MTAAAFTYNLWSDLFLFAYGDDGDPIYHLAWFVVAEDIKTGARWAHDHRETTRDGEDAPYSIKALLARIEAAGVNPVRRGHWNHQSPRYGSLAYAQGEPAMVARERADDEAGFHSRW
jgi:hypothetical protein